MGSLKPVRQAVLDMATEARREGRHLLADQLDDVAAGVPDDATEIPAEVFIWQAADYAARPSVRGLS